VWGKKWRDRKRPSTVVYLMTAFKIFIIFKGMVSICLEVHSAKQNEYLSYLRDMVVLVEKARSVLLQAGIEDTWAQ
jgi:hypothetical protein